MTQMRQDSKYDPGTESRSQEEILLKEAESGQEEKLQKEREEYLKSIQENESLHFRIREEMERYQQRSRDLEHREQVRGAELAAVRAWSDAIDISRKQNEAILELLREPVQNVQAGSAGFARAVEQLTETVIRTQETDYAANRMSFLTIKYCQNFQGYRNARRIISGCIEAVNSPGFYVIDPVQYAEEAYLQSSDYWLSNAGCALVFREQSGLPGLSLLEKAEWDRKARLRERNALRLDPLRSQLFFMLTDLLAGRSQEAGRRSLAYLDCLQENGVDPSLKYVLQAYLSGVMGADSAFAERFCIFYDQMQRHARDARPDYEKEIADRAQAYAETFAIPEAEQFALLKTHCLSVYQEMRGLLRMARRSRNIYEELHAVMETEGTTGVVQGGCGDNDYVGIRKTLTQLIRELTPEEQELLKDYAYYEAVIRTEGDVDAARQQILERKEITDGERLLPDLLFYWALEDSSSETSPEVRRFSIMQLGGVLAQGFEQYADRYRTRFRESFFREENGRNIFSCPVTIDGWTGVCSPQNRPAAAASLRRYYRQSLPQRILRDPYAFLAIGIMVTALIIFAVGTGQGHLVAVVISLAAAVIGGITFVLRLKGLWVGMTDDRKFGTETLERVFSQIDAWEQEYNEADEWTDRLTEYLSEWNAADKIL